MFKQFLALCSCSDSFVRARIMCLSFIRLLPPPLFSTLIQYFSNIFLICFQLSSTFPSHSPSSTFFFCKCTLLLTVILYLLAQLTNMPSAIGAANIDWFLISGKPNFLAEGEAG